MTVASPAAAAAESELQSKLLRLLCAIATLLGCVYGVYFAAAGLASATPIAVLCIAISAVAIGVARVGGSAGPGLDVACVLLFAVLAGMALLQDGVRSPALWWLAVPPIVALVACRWHVGALLCAGFAALASILRAHGGGTWGSVSLLTGDPSTQLTLAMTLSALSTALFVALGSRWRRAATPPQRVAAAPRHAGILVLVAAADRMRRDAVGAILESMPVAWITAEDGAEALSLLTARRFDLVLIDLGLPVLDGLEVASRWRSRETRAGRPRLPIVAMTGDGVGASLQACALAGIDDVLSAPFGVADLELLLSELVARDAGTLGERC